METVLHVHLSGTSSCADRLLSLGHRVLTFRRRAYTFSDGVCASADGTRDPIRAWAEEQTTPSSWAPGCALFERRAVPAPYLAWSSAKVDDASSGLFVQVMITNKLSVYLTDDRPFAEIRVGSDAQKHISALHSVCEVTRHSLVGAASDLESISRAV